MTMARGRRSLSDVRLRSFAAQKDDVVFGLEGTTRVKSCTLAGQSLAARLARFAWRGIAGRFAYHAKWAKALLASAIRCVCSRVFMALPSFL